jgi:hypothetical protein
MSTGKEDPLAAMSSAFISIFVAGVSTDKRGRRVFISATRRRDIENLRWEKGAVLEENLRPNLDEVRMDMSHHSYKLHRSSPAHADR